MAPYATAGFNLYLDRLLASRNVWWTCEACDHTDALISFCSKLHSFLYWTSIAHWGILHAMSDTAVELAQFVKTLEVQDVPQRVLQRTALNILDTIASAAGGYATKNASDMRASSEAFFGPGRSSVWFSGQSVHRAAALLSNCSAASALDIDDGHRGASGHAGASIVPAILQGAGETERNVSARELLVGCAVGYDIACRVAAARPRGTVKTYSAGRWVGYGVAAALGWLQRLPAETIAHGMTIAGAESPENLPAGSYRRMSSVKGGSPWSTLTASVALERAKAGAEGPLDSLDRADVFDRAAMLRDLGTRWEVEHTYLKPYASCRYAHAATDATLALVAGQVLRAEHVEDLIVEVFPEAFTITNEPAPQTLEGAQFSIPFNVAVAALRGAAAFRPMDERLLRDAEILSLARRIQLIAGADFAKSFPLTTPSRVKLKLSGRWHEHTVTHPLGDVDNPMSWSQVEQKYLDLCGSDTRMRTHAGKIIKLCKQLPASEGSGTELLAHLSLTP